MSQPPAENVQDPNQNKPEDLAPPLNSEEEKLINIVQMLPLLVDLPPPILRPPVDRYCDELEVLKPLEVGGLLGRGLLGLIKPSIVREEQKVLGESDKIALKDMKVDGIYTKGAQELTYNMQKLEQRLLRIKELSYFHRSNWELRLDSDLTTHFLSRPLDISLEPNPNTYLKNISALYSHRNNATKTKYYRLDLYLGVVNFRDHAMFCEEDYLAAQVKYLFYKYERRVSLCLVDHLENRLSALNEELQDKTAFFQKSTYAASTSEQAKNKLFEEDIEIIQQSVTETQNRIEEERKTLQDMAEMLYNKWLDLKNQRQKQGHSNTSIKLGVRTIILSGKPPEYDFYLQSDNPADVINNNEKSRRLLIQATRIFVRIIVNGIYVTRTTKRFLTWPNFEVFFGERFELHLFTRPVKVRLEICTGMRWTRTLATLEFTPPGLNVRAMTSTGTFYKDLEFIGSIPMKGMFTDGNLRKVTGNITLKSSWVGHSEKMPPIRFEDLALLPRKAYEIPADLATYIDVNDPRNKDLLQYLMMKREEQIQKLLKEDAHFPHFRFNAYRYLLYSERYNFSALIDLPVPMLEKDIWNNPLLKRIILTIQTREPTSQKIKYFYVQSLKNTFIYNKPGVVRMRQLMHNFKIKQNRVRLGFEKDKTALENVVREFIMIESKYLLQCWKFIFTPRRKLLPRKKQIPKVAVSELATCKITIMIYKAVNVPIRTIGIEKEKKYIQNDVIGAKKKAYALGPSHSQQGFGNRPYGSYNNSMPMPNQAMGEDLQRPIGSRVNEIDEDRIIRYGLVERVQSFVEVVLNHNEKTNIVRTIPFDGAFPEWNELLEITFTSLNKTEFTIDELLECDSILYFNLYDQLLSTASTVHINEYKVKLERRFLGSFELPMLTILQNPNGIEASFRMSRPLCLQGYRIQRTDPFKAEEDKGVFNDPEKPTYISVRINLEPVLELPVDNEAEYYAGFESPSLLFFGSNWLSAVKNKKSILKERRVYLWAENTEGQSVFLPRFLTPLEPPIGLIAENDMDSIAKVARYVSLIPHIEDNQAFKDLPDIWSTCQEFLDLSFGDYEEHAILLCNYFKWIDKDKPNIKNYIIIGTGVPEGKSVYVLRRDTTKGDLELWNASSGVGYSIIQDPYSAKFLCINISRGTKNRVTDKEYTIGLKSVGCVFDENDIYFNIQDYSDPYVIDFNIDNPKSWMPFIGNSTRRATFFPNNVITTIQKPLEYEVSPEVYLTEIQLNLEKHLREKFQEAKIKGDNRGFRWASHHINNRISELFPVLELFYSSFRAGASESSLYTYQRESAQRTLNEVEQKLIEILSPNSFGASINSPLESPDKIWAKVKNTDVHNIGYDNCTYVLAVRIIPYPGFVASVWVYIGVIFGDATYRTY